MVAVLIKDTDFVHSLGQELDINTCTIQILLALRIKEEDT